MPDDAPVNDRPNSAMTDNWNGIGGETWVANAAHHDRQLAGFGDDILVAAALTPTDRVLDIGCGTGGFTRAAARLATQGEALGVDIGRPLVEAARAQAAAEGPANVRFEQADAQVHPFVPKSVDVVLSRFGVMFFDDPGAAFANVRTAVDDGGRLAFVCWRTLDHNPWTAVSRAALSEHLGPSDLGPPDAPGPFSLADPDRIRAVLAEGGFTRVTVDEVSHPMWLGSDVDEAVRGVKGQMFARTLFAGKPPDLIDRAVAALRAALAEVAGPDGIVLASSAWLVTARAG
jgi:SAM-dependent methyltransferase